MYKIANEAIWPKCLYQFYAHLSTSKQKGLRTEGLDRLQDSENEVKTLVKPPKKANKGPLVEGRDYEFNEQGLMVFTRSWHLSRGYCCGSGCLHCPWKHLPLHARPRAEEDNQKTDETRIKE